MPRTAAKSAVPLCIVCAVQRSHMMCGSEYTNVAQYAGYRDHRVRVQEYATAVRIQHQISPQTPACSVKSGAWEGRRRSNGEILLASAASGGGETRRLTEDPSKRQAIRLALAYHPGVFRHRAA